MTGTREETVLVVGPTEIMGRALVRLLARGGWRVFALTHPDERPAVEALRSRLDNEEHAPGFSLDILWGDSTSAGAGLDPRVIDQVARDIRTIIHCPPLYIKDKESYHGVIESVVKSTDQIIALAHRFPNLKLLAHVSSAFISGNYPGRFYEDWLDVGQDFYDPINRNHFIAETKLKNASRSVPIITLRCGFLIGEAETGACEENEGLVPLFKVLSAYAAALPRPLPILAPDSEEKVLSLSPTDYAAKAALHIIRSGESIGRTFCLVDPSSPTMRAFVDNLSDLQGRTCYRVPMDMLGRLPLFEPMVMAEWIGFFVDKFKRSSYPLRFLFNKGDYDVTNTKQALAGSSVVCPSFKTYIERLYRYYMTRYA
jgi:thioester reductase-like protein